MSEAIYPNLREAHIASCRKNIEQAQGMLARVKDGWAFHASHGDHPLQDITAERVSHWEAVIKKSEAIIEAYRRVDAQGA